MSLIRSVQWFFNKPRSSFYLLLLVFSASLKPASAQWEEETPVTEWSFGLKTTWGEFEYGPRYFERTRFQFPGILPMMRVDMPLRLMTIRETPLYINLTASGGLLYLPNKPGIVQYQDPVSGQTSNIPRKDPLYAPFYFGIYNSGPFGAGVEVFYAKGLNGVSDIWGGKLAGLTYASRRFRINVAWEVALPVKFDTDYPSQFFSFDFLWKLGQRTE